MDYFSRWLEARPLRHANATSVAIFIYKEIICRYGSLKVIQSDQGTHFVNQVIEQLTERFRIRHSLSSAYHPQSNGLVERFNRTLCEGIAKVAKTICRYGPPKVIQSDQGTHFVNQVIEQLTERNVFLGHFV